MKRVITMHEDQSRHEPDAQTKSKASFSQNIHTNGGAHVSGNVSVKKGDFVGRDKVVSIFVSPGWITLFLLVVVLVGIAASSLILLQRRTSCDPPAGWVKYSVRQGDTAWSLAISYGVTPSTLRINNCLTLDSLDPGQVIFVPPEVIGQVCGTPPH